MTEKKAMELKQNEILRRQKTTQEETTEVFGSDRPVHHFVQNFFRLKNGCEQEQRLIFFIYDHVINDKGEFLDNPELVPEIYLRDLQRQEDFEIL